MQSIHVIPKFKLFNMRTYISDIIPRIQKFSQKLDNLTLLTNQHWVVIDDIDETKNVYIFRQNNELLISRNGKVERAKWEYLGNNSLLIDLKEQSYLFRHGFFDENVLALKLDSKEEYAFLVNETKYDREQNSSKSVTEFLNRKYVNSPINILETPTHPKAYFTPNYTVNKIGMNSSMLGGLTEQYLIKFQDGESGEVFLVQSNNQSYFKDKNGWVTYMRYYENLDKCISALHFYIKKGIVSELGYEVI